MTTWQKLALKFLKWFAPVETLRDVALQYLNDFLAKTNVAANVSKAVKFVGIILPILEAAKGPCPDRWREEYNALVTSVVFLRDILLDGEVSPAEAQAAVEGVKIGIDKWINE
jgi:hypothetical protein